MFYKEIKDLKKLSVSLKIAITSFLIIAGIGYILGFLNIYFTYSPVDKKPGLSLTDISLSFLGSGKTTKLEKAIDGSMHQYFENEKDYNEVKEWIISGGNKEQFSTIKKIIDPSCNECHSSKAKVADVILESYDDIGQYLIKDTGKSLSRLVSISHTHILGILPIIFILTLIFSFTLYSERLKSFVIGFAFFSIVLDIGSWWIVKYFVVPVILIPIGGAFLALSFLMLIILSLFEMWIKKVKSQ